MRKIFLMILIAAGIGIAVIALRHTKKTDSGTGYREIERIAVSTVPAVKCTLREELRYTGVLEAKNQATVISQTTGIVGRTPFEVGQWRMKDQILAVVENTIQKAAVEQAEAQVLAAETNYRKAQNDSERVLKLFRDSVTTKNDLENAMLNVKAVLAQLKTAQAGLVIALKQLADTYIKASINGRIAAKRIDPGALVSPGSEIAVLVDDLQFKIKIAVGERDVIKVRQKQQVIITIDAIEHQTFNGVVQNIGSIPVEGGRSYPVEILLETVRNTMLKTGMFARCAIVVRVIDSALTVPEQAIVTTPDSGSSVYIPEQGRIKKVPVVVGITVEENCEIVSGLKEGSRVVTGGKERVNSGTLITEEAGTK
jgi:membrane fusion protein (multidrug efflux system)